MTDNLLQYQDIDPAPSFSKSSPLHSSLPISSVSAISNSAALSYSNKIASKKPSADKSLPASQLSDPFDNAGFSDLQSSSIFDRVSSKFPLLSPFRPVSTDSHLNFDSSTPSKRRLKIVMPTELISSSNNIKTSASAVIRPALDEDYDYQIVTEDEFEAALSVVNDSTLPNYFNLSLSATNTNTPTNDSNTLMDDNNKEALQDQPTYIQHTTENIDVVPTFPSNKTDNKEESHLDIPMSRETSTIQLRNNLKPIIQLSPNASFVRILSRQINGVDSDIQSIKSIKRLRLRPLTLARTTLAPTTETLIDVMSEDENTNNGSQSNLESKIYENDLTTISETELNDNHFLKMKNGSFPFPNRIQSNEIDYLSDVVPKRSQDSVPSRSSKSKPIIVTGRSATPRLPSTVTSHDSVSGVADSSPNIRPSYRLTSRLSSNHPAARIQTLSSDKENDNANSPNFKSRSPFRTPSLPTTTNNIDFDNVGSRIRARFPPKFITHSNFSDAPSHKKFTNIKREPLTESPNKIRITTQNPVEKEFFALTTDFVVESDTESPTHSEVVDFEPSEEKMVQSTSFQKDSIKTLTEIPIFDTSTEASVVPSKATLSFPKIISSTEQSANVENYETTTSIVTKWTYGPLKPTELVILEASTTTTEMTINKKYPDLHENQTETTTVKVKTYNNLSSTKKVDIKDTTEEKNRFPSTLLNLQFNGTNTAKLSQLNQDDGKEKTKSHPLLSSLRNRAHLTSNLNNTNSDNIDKFSNKSSSDKSPFKSLLLSKNNLSDKQMKASLNSSSVNSTIHASSFATTSPKPSAGRLGLLFPAPRSDVAVSLRYVIDVFPNIRCCNYFDLLSQLPKEWLWINSDFEEAWCHMPKNCIPYRNSELGDGRRKCCSVTR